MTRAHVIDSPNKPGCHGKDVIASLRQTWGGNVEHAVHNRC